jgi:GNAT superfamily N-acetyltransferase
MPVLVRPATPDDAEAMRRIYLAAGREAWAEFLPAAEIGANDAAFSGDLGFVAEEDGAVVGFAWLRGSELDTLYTHPGVWGRGAGRALMDAALAGLPEATLWTAEQNARARRVYERYGWRPDGEKREKTYVGVTFTELRYKITR